MNAAVWLLVVAGVSLLLAMTLPTGDQPQLQRADIPAYVAMCVFTGSFVGSILLIVTGASAL
jgi:hypothetical protein